MEVINGIQMNTKIKVRKEMRKVLEILEIAMVGVAVSPRLRRCEKYGSGKLNGKRSLTLKKKQTNQSEKVTAMLEIRCLLMTTTKEVGQSSPANRTLVF